MTVKVAATGSFMVDSLTCLASNPASFVYGLVCIVANCALRDGTRRPAGAGGLSLAAGRCACAAEHQRGAGASADGLARCLRRRAVAGRMAPLPRPHRIGPPGG